MLHSKMKSWIVLGLTSLLLINLGNPALAKKKSSSICEDDLSTQSGLKWGGSKRLPFKRVVDIRECLVDSQLGKITASRHGKGNKADIGEIFGRRLPEPGERFFISLWGSKIEGCFVEMVVQHAPQGGRIEKEAIIPTSLELGVAGQLIELPPFPSLEPKIFQADYTYTKTTSGAAPTSLSQVFSGGSSRSVRLSSTWYMSRNSFLIDSQLSQILRNAPDSEVRARLKFANNDTQLITIDQRTVNSWSEAFGFNPTCENLSAQS